MHTLCWLGHVSKWKIPSSYNGWLYTTPSRLSGDALVMCKLWITIDKSQLVILNEQGTHLNWHIMHPYTSTGLHIWEWGYMITCSNIHKYVATHHNDISAGSNHPGHNPDLKLGPGHSDWIFCNTKWEYSMPCTAMPHSLPLSGEHHTILHIQHQNKLPAWCT